MSRLLSIKTPLHELTEDQLMEQIRKSRDARKIRKYSAPEMRPKNQESRAGKVKANLGKLTPGELALLMKEFG